MTCAVPGTTSVQSGKSFAPGPVLSAAKILSEARSMAFLCIDSTTNMPAALRRAASSASFTVGSAASRAGAADRVPRGCDVASRQLLGIDDQVPLGRVAVVRPNPRVPAAAVAYHVSQRGSVGIILVQILKLHRNVHDLTAGVWCGSVYHPALAVRQSGRGTQSSAPSPVN